MDDLEGFDQLVSHCILQSTGSDDAGDAQLLAVFPNTYDDTDITSLGQALFERVSARKVCFLSSPELLLSCANARALHSLGLPPVSTAIIVDIGAQQTRVSPIFEDFLLSKIAKVTPVGGEHITEFLALMLYSGKNDVFNGLLPRRAVELARKIKEQYAFVAEESLSAAQARYGKFAVEKQLVMGKEFKEFRSREGAVGGGEASHCDDGNGKGASAPSGVQPVNDERDRGRARDIRVSAESRLPDGSQLALELDIERFHCTEVLFDPTLFEGCRQAAGLLETIVAVISEVDECARADLAGTIVIAGGSACLPGLAERIEVALQGMLRPVGLTQVRVVRARGPTLAQPPSAVATSMKLSSGFDVHVSDEMYGGSERVRSAIAYSSTAQSGGTGSEAMGPSTSFPIDPHRFVTAAEYDDGGSAMLPDLLLN